MTKKNKKESIKEITDWEFWKGAAIRGIAVAGYSFFGLLITMDLRTCALSSAIAGGAYVFTEAVRHYKIHKEDLPKKKTYSFCFLIHP